MTTFAQKREPSLRMRQPSSSKRPSFGAITSSRAGRPRSIGLGWIEHGEMLADDFLGRVSLDGLGAAIPAHDAARGIEHEQRIVAHRLDEDAKAEVVHTAHRGAGIGRQQGRIHRASEGG